MLGWLNFQASDLGAQGDCMMWVKREFDDFAAIKREMDRTFRDSFGLWAEARSRVWRPPTDVYETSTHVVVKVEIAGMKEGDFSICLSERVLSIAGHRRDPADKLVYQQMEINYGSFLTEVHLPGPLDEDNIEAVYREGFLTIKLPKAGRTQVPINRGGA
jgi:HSP20 family protein